MLSAVTENEPIAELAAAPCSAPCAFGQEEARRIQEELEKDLEAHEISHRSGGSAGSVAYMEGWRAIEKATHIFGFNGWSSRIIEIKKEYEAQDKGKQKWDTCYSAIVRIELKDGTFHEDVGLGNGLDRDRHKAIESARKEAVTDGMKRALRHYGNALGLSVYNKQQVKETMKRPSAPPPATTALALAQFPAPAPALAQFPAPAPTFAQFPAPAPAFAQFSAPAPAFAQFPAPAPGHSPPGAPSHVAPGAPACPPHAVTRPAPAPPDGEAPPKRHSAQPPHATLHPASGHAPQQGWVQGQPGRAHGGVWPHQLQAPALPHPQLSLPAPQPPLPYPPPPPVPSAQSRPAHSPPEHAAAPVLPVAVHQPPAALEEFADSDRFDAALRDFHC